MTPPPILRADRLWRRLAQAQDAALEREAPPSPPIATRRRVRIRMRPMLAGMVTLGAVAALVALFVHRGPGPLQVRVGQGTPTGEMDRVMDRVLVADARSDLPLQFSDGSNLTFHAGSTGRMQRLGDDGAEVFLEKGRLEAHVVHADRTLWLVHAGPYRVRVTGTRFSVVWAAGWLDVALFEGSVMIDGAVLGAGVPLRAGQRLTVDRGTVRTEALTHASAASAAPPVAAVAIGAAPPPAPGEAPPAVAAPEARPALAAAPSGPIAALAATPGSAAVAGPGLVPGAVVGPSSGDLSIAILRSRASDGDWYTLSKQSAYVESFAAARRAGWTRLCRHLDAHRLLALGDVARYAGARPRAREAFEALVTRFPRSPLAADASFSLGRLAFEADQSDRAARWFRRYVADWPHGPLADQAVGRLVECALRSHDAEAARSAARAYLARAPSGPHARLARQILRESAGAAAGANPGIGP